MFIALKSCKFDRPYAIGETIPEEVVDPKRVESLRSYGLIDYAPEQAKVVEPAPEVKVAETAPRRGRKSAHAEKVGD